MSDTDHKMNLLRLTKTIVVDPPPQIIVKADTGAKAHHFAQAGAHALLDAQPTKMGPQVRLPDNNKMDPEQVGHLPLALLAATTETHVFSEFQNASSISVYQICDDDCQTIFNKNPFNCWTKIKTSF